MKIKLTFITQARKIDRFYNVVYSMMIPGRFIPSPLLKNKCIGLQIREFLLIQRNWRRVCNDYAGKPISYRFFSRFCNRSQFIYICFYLFFVFIFCFEMLFEYQHSVFNGKFFDNFCF